MSQCADVGNWVDVSFNDNDFDVFQSRANRHIAFNAKLGLSDGTGPTLNRGIETVDRQIYISAAGERGFEVFTGLPPNIVDGSDDGVDFVFRQKNIDVKTTEHPTESPHVIIQSVAYMKSAHCFVLAQFFESQRRVRLFGMIGRNRFINEHSIVDHGRGPHMAVSCRDLTSIQGLRDVGR